MTLQCAASYAREVMNAENFPLTGAFAVPYNDLAINDASVSADTMIFVIASNARRNVLYLWQWLKKQANTQATFCAYSPEVAICGYRL